MVKLKFVCGSTHQLQQIPIREKSEIFFANRSVNPPVCNDGACV